MVVTVSHILMVLTLLCGVNFTLSDSQVVQLCPGQSAELSCMVSERDSIVWNGTAFTNQCPDTDSISVTRNNTDNSLTTPSSCGRFNAENIFVNATDSRFPGVDFTAIMSTLSFMINDTTLSGNTNILCNIAHQDNPNVNATITLYDITPKNLSFNQSSLINTFYWSVDNESQSECNLTFNITIMALGVPPSGFSPLTVPTAEGGVYVMACATLTPGDYEFFVSSTSGSITATSDPYRFSVPQPITGVEISNITCDSATITFTTNAHCTKYAIMAELCDNSSRCKKNGSVSNTIVYNFSDLEKGVTYNVCAIILDPANNNIMICGNDLPNNGKFTTLAKCSGSISTPHFQLLVAAIVLRILFVL